jgi:Skp family chaperone for outer membrane proteins
MKLSETAGLVLCLALPMGVLESQVQTKVAQTQMLPIVVVNFNALVLQTNESQRDLSALEAKFAPRQAQLQALNDDIETSRKQLADLGDKLNDQQRASRTQLLEAKVKRLQRLAEDFRSDSQTEGQEAFQKVAQRRCSPSSRNTRGNMAIPSSLTAGPTRLLLCGTQLKTSTLPRNY